MTPAVMTRLNEFADRLSALTDRPSNRTVGLLLGLPSATVVGLAAWLTPATQGFGTHMQLGLGGCAMLTMTGWPCPMCGMTTTFALMAHFRPLDAFVNQPFGVVLFSLTLLTALLGIADMVTGRGVIRQAFRWVGRREQLLAVGLLVGMIGGWIYKCIRMHPSLLS
ncbi:MAG: DUF2752 domain-containing protein [Pseudomonadota bacterium]|nr:DUF2752 domain-containing protein [Pseudomonadota bacterium]